MTLAEIAASGITPESIGIAKDLVKHAAIVFALVEVLKDLWPGAPAGVVRVAVYAAALFVSALAVWVPGMPWREYLLATFYQAILVGSMAIGGHATFQRVAAPAPVEGKDRPPPSRPIPPLPPPPAQPPEPAPAPERAPEVGVTPRRADQPKDSS